MSHAILQRAQEKGALVEDLQDVHNMMWVSWRYDKVDFAPARAESRGGTKQEEAETTVPGAPADETIYEFIRRRHFVFPLNVYVTGTVNVDESTFMFSPKVLDRANVIEFHDVVLAPDDGGAFASLEQIAAAGEGNAAESGTNLEPAFEERDGSAGYESGMFVLRDDVPWANLLSGYTPPNRAAWDEMS